MLDRRMHDEAPARVLKKYGNRRLYDTGDSRYVTLAEVEALVQEGARVEVVDAKTGDDLTRAVLTQIICEREESRAVLPIDFLRQVIRVGASEEGRVRFSDQLRQTVRSFADAQRSFASEVQKMQAAALESMRQNPFLSGPGMNPFNYPRDERAPRPEEVYRRDDETRAELDELRAELKATQKVIRELVQKGD